MIVYVQNKEGHPLMPTQRCGHVRYLLKKGQAKVVRMTPFTIRLKYNAGEEKQDIILGVDVGSRHIGISASSNIKEVFSSICEIRDDISKYVHARKVFRQNRHKRNCRYRKRRYFNRRRSQKWRTPSINGKINGHLRVIKIIMQILPVTKIRLETAEFDVSKLQRAIEFYARYPVGNSKTYSHIREYVKWRDGYLCSNCRGRTRDKKLEVHHLIRRRDGGTNIPNNLITLCHTCHQGFHSGILKLDIKRNAIVRLRDSTAMNLIRGKLVELCKFTLGDGVVVEETFGVETKMAREGKCIPKTHNNDAFCITGNLLAERLGYFYIQKCLRRHNRRLHKQTILSPKNYKGQRVLTSKEKRNGYRALFQTTYEICGIRLYDRVKYKGQIGYISARNARGYYRIRDIKGRLIAEHINRKKVYLLEHSRGIITERMNFA